MGNNNENLYDLIIIGGGPAGLTSAIYMARARYKTLVLEKESRGGQITITKEVVNYPGILQTTGTDLMNDMAIQAKKFGAVIKNEEVIDLDLNSDIKKVITKNHTYETISLIIATGANPRKLGFKGEKEFQGRGVAYCATCDGEFFTDKDIFVVGGGFAACEEGIFLTRYGRSVTMLVREDDFTAAKSIADKVKNHPDIKVHYNTEVVEITGDTFPKTLTYKNNKTKEVHTYKAEDNDTFGTFVFAGYVPNTNLIKDKVTLDRGYVVTDENKMTNIKGVFAAGDLCIKNLRQVVTATADGAIAATSAEKHAKEIHEKLGINPLFDESTILKIDDMEEKTTKPTDSTDKLITDDMKKQLENVFSKFERKLDLIFHINGTAIGQELEQYFIQMENISENLKCKKEKIEDNITAYITLQYDGKDLGYKYVGVPGGHEFTSFILTLYNYSGKGQSLEDTQIEKINKIHTPLKVDVVVSLSCTKCPELVVAASQIMGKLKEASFTVSDIGHASHLKEKYKIMSVPCMIVNDEQVIFGKKNTDELIDILSD